MQLPQAESPLDVDAAAAVSSASASLTYRLFAFGENASPQRKILKD
jgi:hypothetical protein